MKMAKYCQDEVELFRLKLRVRSWLHSKGKLNPQRCLAEWLHHSQGSGSCFPGEREAEWGQSGCRGPPMGMARGCRNPDLLPGGHREPRACRLCCSVVFSATTGKDRVLLTTFCHKRCQKQLPGHACDKHGAFPGCLCSDVTQQRKWSHMRRGKNRSARRDR